MLQWRIGRNGDKWCGGQSFLWNEWVIQATYEGVVKLSRERGCGKNPKRKIIVIVLLNIKYSWDTEKLLGLHFVLCKERFNRKTEKKGQNKIHCQRFKKDICIKRKMVTKLWPSQNYRMKKVMMLTDTIRLSKTRVGPCHVRTSSGGKHKESRTAGTIAGNRLGER